MDNLIQKQWESFEARVVSKDARPMQRREMKFAFFGGASALYFEIMSNVSNPASNDEVLFRNLNDELMTFAKRGVTS